MCMVFTLSNATKWVPWQQQIYAVGIQTLQTLLITYKCMPIVGIELVILSSSSIIHISLF